MATTAESSHRIEINSGLSQSLNAEAAKRKAGIKVSSCAQAKETRVTACIQASPAALTPVVYNEEDSIVKGFPRVDHPGYFVIWTEGALRLLDEVVGTFDKVSTRKRTTCAPHFSFFTSVDLLTRIQAAHVQPPGSDVRPTGQKLQKRPWTQKKKPLVSKAVLRLSSYAKTIRRQYTHQPCHRSHLLAISCS
jgi:hypothetical protein